MDLPYEILLGIAEHCDPVTCQRFQMTSKEFSHWTVFYDRYVSDFPKCKIWGHSAIDRIIRHKINSFAFYRHYGHIDLTRLANYPENGNDSPLLFVVWYYFNRHSGDLGKKMIKRMDLSEYYVYYNLSRNSEMVDIKIALALLQDPEGLKQMIEICGDSLSIDKSCICNEYCIYGNELPKDNSKKKSNHHKIKKNYNYAAVQQSMRYMNAAGIFPYSWIIEYTAATLENHEPQVEKYWQNLSLTRKDFVYVDTIRLAKRLLLERRWRLFVLLVKKSALPQHLLNFDDVALPEAGQITGDYLDVLNYFNRIRPTPWIVDAVCRFNRFDILQDIFIDRDMVRRIFEYGCRQDLRALKWALSTKYADELVQNYDRLLQIAVINKNDDVINYLAHNYGSVGINPLTKIQIMDQVSGETLIQLFDCKFFDESDLAGVSQNKRELLANHFLLMDNDFLLSCLLDL